MFKKHIITQLDEQNPTPVKDAKNAGLYNKKGKVRVKWQVKELTLINAKCMVYGHDYKVDGACTRPSCGAGL